MGYYYSDNTTRIESQAKAYQGLSAVIKSQLEKDNPRRKITQRQEVAPHSIEALLGAANIFAKKWNKPLEDIQLEQTAYDDYGSCCSALYLEVDGLETDMQYQARLFEAYENMQRQEERERREFERLSAKFSKK